MPALAFEQIHQKLSAKIAEGIGPAQPAKKDAWCAVAPARLIEACRFLKGDPELSFDFLEDLTAVDHPKENLIRVVYHLYSYRHRHSFKFKAELDRAKPRVSTVEGVWKAANWLEREVLDLFGVEFEGHSDPRRIMLPPDWVGHPLRKDYVEQGGYQGITNIRDNPLDLYLQLDQTVKAQTQASAPPAAPAAAPKAEH
jgi:NADH-quinone oxidoreductase subunit C